MLVSSPEPVAFTSVRSASRHGAREWGKSPVLPGAMARQRDPCAWPLHPRQPGGSTRTALRSGMGRPCEREPARPAAGDPRQGTCRANPACRTWPGRPGYCVPPTGRASDRLARNRREHRTGESERQHVRKPAHPSPPRVGVRRAISQDIGRCECSLTAEPGHATGPMPVVAESAWRTSPASQAGPGTTPSSRRSGSRIGLR